MVDQKNKRQSRDLKNYLEQRLDELTRRLDKFKKQMETEGFSAELHRQINIAEYSVLVCNRRIKGNIADPRNELEISIPKRTI